MLSKKIEDALNQQIKGEISSAYLYLSMSAYSSSINLGGFAHWLRLQNQEEISHAMRLFDYVNNRGGRVILQGMDRPSADFKSPVSLFELVFKHEQEVSASINKLYELAVQEKDHATEVELHWFIQEQVEEEKNAGQILKQLNMIGEQPAALLMMDRQLSSRSPID